MIKNAHTTSETRAKFFRETLADYKINFIEKRRGNMFVFRPTRVHKKRFHNCMVQARSLMLEKRIKVVDCVE